MQPYLNVPARYRQQTNRFGGLDRNASIRQGRFADMENLCADQYPVLSTRPGRTFDRFPGKTGALYSGDGLIRVEGSALVLPDRRVELGLTEGEKTLCAMGAYVLVFPDKKYASLTDPEDMGGMEASFTPAGRITVTPCTLEGGDRLPDYVQEDSPEEPENKCFWLDTSETPPVLKQWSGESAMWVTEETAYVRLEAQGIGRDFRAYDSVWLSGAGALDGANTVWAREEDRLVITGILGDTESLPQTLTIARRVPEMDWVTECGNRLWGCRAGKNAQGETVNELYASRLGDFRNWESFLGLSTDSFSVSVGSPGPFTGAVTHLGTPLFFKEDCLYKVYGSYPANFRVQCTPCRGVQPGCGRSLAIVGEMLYYKSPMGVCAFDGSLPQEIGEPLGMAPFENAVGAGFGGKYYLSMEEKGADAIYVYDTFRGLWHKETGLGARQMVSCRGKLYALDGQGRVHCLRGEESPEKVEWMAKTGRIDGWEPERYLTGITLHMVLAPYARAEILVRYDSAGPWESAGAVTGRGERFRLPIRPRKCSHLELMLKGTGQMQLFSLTRILQKGRDGL